MTPATRALVAVIIVQAFVNALLAGSLHYVTSALVRASQRGCM